MKTKLFLTVLASIVALGVFYQKADAKVYKGVEIPEGDVAFADVTGVTSYYYSPGANVDTPFNDPYEALGVPDSDEDTFFTIINTVSLGDGGSIILQFTDNALTTSGNDDEDLWVFEAGAAVEATDIEISVNGTDWIDVGSVEGSTSGVDIDASISSGVSLWEKYYFVRITDDDSMLSSTTPFAGADIDALGAISSEPPPPPNIPPTANAGVDQTVAISSGVTLSGALSFDQDDGLDPDGYMWNQIGGTTLVSLSGISDVSPTFTAPGIDDTLVFQLSVTDYSGATDVDTCIVNVVTPPNVPPTAIINPAEQTVPENVTVTMNGAGSFDPDGGDISAYSWTQVSGVTGFTLSGASTAIATFTSPDVDISGSALMFELTVTDNEGSQNTAICIVNVTNVNEAPIADAGPNQTVNSGVTVTLDGSGSYDPDNGDVIQTYAWSQISGPTVVLDDPRAQVSKFTLSTSEAVSLEFLLSVTDNGGLKGYDTCIVNIKAAGDTNVEPTAVAAADVTLVLVGDTVTLDGSGSSDDIGIVSYEWRQLSGPPATLSDSTSVSCDFTAPAVTSGKSSSVLIFELVVKDGEGLRDSDTISVTVVNQLPSSGGSGGNTCFIQSIWQNN